MAFEAVRGYVQLASGLGELTKTRAQEAAQGLPSLPAVSNTGRVAAQVTALADELLAAATTNRENLTALVRHEVEAAVGRLGLVPVTELEAVQAQVIRLKAELADVLASAEGRAAEAVSAAAMTLRRGTGTSATSTAPAGTTTAKRATKATAKPAGKATTKTATKSAATKSAATKSAATKSAATKSAATKSAATKS